MPYRLPNFIYLNSLSRLINELARPTAPATRGMTNALAIVLVIAPSAAACKSPSSFLNHTLSSQNSAVDISQAKPPTGQGMV